MVSICTQNGFYFPDDWSIQSVDHKAQNSLRKIRKYHIHIFIKSVHLRSIKCYRKPQSKSNEDIMTTIDQTAVRAD